MQAIVCSRRCPPERLSVEERVEPTPGPGELLAQLHAAGVNLTDLLAVERALARHRAPR